MDDALRTKTRLFRFQRPASSGQQKKPAAGCWRLAAGFTLVELMAASVITAFLAMVAVGGLVSVTSARSSLDEATETMDELRYVVDLLRQDMANMYRDRRELLFEGTVEERAGGTTPRLRFRTIGTVKTRPNQPEGDLYEIEYLFVDRGDGALALSRRVCPIVGVEVEPQQTAGGILTRLSDRISFFGVRYFNGAEWLASWPIEQRQLPQLMELSLAAKIVDKNGKERIFARQAIVTFPRLWQQVLDESEMEGAEASLQMEFTEPEAGIQ